LLNGVLGRGPNPDANRRIAFLLVLASVPAAVAGLAFGSFFEATFERPYQTCAELLLTAILLLACEHLGDRASRRSIDAPRATGIGVAQAAAILPGISRSGATIGAGLWFGMSREEATRFSFLLSIPAIFGAGVLDMAEGDLAIGAASLAGTAAAAVSSYFAIAILIRFVRSHSLRVFAYYLFGAAPVYAGLIAIQR
ncbi:MAG: undecaprenyl-diphosphate phosphatase, partial [Acidimicrobiia bacterium]